MNLHYEDETVKLWHGGQRDPVEAIRLAGDDLGLFDSEAWQ